MMLPLLQQQQLLLLMLLLMMMMTMLYRWAVLPVYRVDGYHPLLSINSLDGFWRHFFKAAQRMKVRKNLKWTWKTPPCVVMRVRVSHPKALFVCLLLNSTSALFRPLVPWIIEVEYPKACLTRFWIGIIRLNQPIVLKDSFRHFYSITSFSRVFDFIIVFDYACQIAVGYIFVIGAIVYVFPITFF